MLTGSESKTIAPQNRKSVSSFVLEFWRQTDSSRSRRFLLNYSHSCECRGVPFHSPLQLRALVVYTLLVVLSPQRVSQGLLDPPRGLIHTLFASPLDGTVSSSFPHPPPLQRRWQKKFPQLTLRLAQNFSSITYLRQGIEWLSHECELFIIQCEKWFR